MYEHFETLLKKWVILTMGCQMPKWQRAAVLDLTQREAGVQVFHVGQVDQLFERKV